MKTKLNCQGPLPYGYKFLAGAFGGAVATLLTYPLDVLRVRLALVRNSTWNSTLKQGGLYQGLAPTMLGIIPYSGTSWMVKQYLLQLHYEYHSRKERFMGDELLEPSSSSYDSICHPSLVESLVMNAIAGLSGQFVTYPLDIVRRRMQLINIGTSTPRGIGSVLRELIEVEGVRGLGKGFSLNIIKGPITMSLSLTTYDMLMKKIREYKAEKNIS